MKNLLFFSLAILLGHSALAQTTCSAGFTYLANNQNVSFTHTSTPSTPPSGPYKLQRLIYFGDGNWQFSWGVNSHTYSAPGTYQVAVVIRVIDSVNNTTACMDSVTQSITVTAPPCSTSISHNITGNSVTFTANNIANTPGMSYSWDFGDGNTGTGSPVTHTYIYTNNWNVTLTASSTSANCSLTSSTSVYVPVSTIVGTIYADSTVIDTFKVWLIQFDSASNNLYAVDSVIVSNQMLQRPYYQFFNYPNGQYRLKAHQLDGPSSGTGFIPTYSLSSLYWNTASVISHNMNSWSDIVMQIGSVTSGPGFVGGNVTQGANKGTGNGVEGQLVFLRDVNDKVIQMAYTDANGDYLFSGVPTGAYDVYPEEMGYTTTPHSFIILASKPSVTGIGFEKHDVSKVFTPVNTGVSEIAANTTLGIYPNPTSGEVYITLGTLDVKASITISDVTGRMVYQNNVNMKAGRANLDVSDLQAGMYFITIADGNVSATKKLVLKK